MRRDDPITILVFEWATGGLAGGDVPASWLAEGRAMRRAIAADFAAITVRPVRVIVVMDASEADVSGPWQVQRLTRRQGVEGLVRLASHADYTLLIAPETTGILAGLVRCLNSRGSLTLGCDPSSIELTGNKHRLQLRFEVSGVPTPHGRLIPSGASIPSDFPFPAVLKPVDGAGSIETYCLASPESLPLAHHSDGDRLLQRFHEGIAMSASFLVARDGTPWLIGMGRQTMQLREDHFTYTGGVIPLAINAAEPAVRRAIQSVPGLRGFVGVDFLWDAKRRATTVLEINPRVTTSYLGLSRLLPPGRLASAWLAACGVCEGDPNVLETLAEEVHSQQPVRFDVEPLGKAEVGIEP